MTETMTEESAGEHSRATLINKPQRERWVKDFVKPLNIKEPSKKKRNEKADVVEFINGLPSHNQRNFSSFLNEPTIRYSGKLSAYLATEERPPQQVIIAERSNVLLRYLHQQWLKKNVPKKRDLNPDVPETSGGSSKKRARSN